MRDLKLDDLAAYERQVGQSAAELQELIEEVIVAESWFFRDERPFEWLRDHVRATVAQRTGAPPLANSQPAVRSGRRALFHCDRALGTRASGSQIPH